MTSSISSKSNVPMFEFGCLEVRKTFIEDCFNKLDPHTLFTLRLVSKKISEKATEILNNEAYQSGPFKEYNNKLNNFISDIIEKNITRFDRRHLDSCIIQASRGLGAPITMIPRFKRLLTGLKDALSNLKHDKFGSLDDIHGYLKRSDFFKDELKGIYRSVSDYTVNDRYHWIVSQLKSQGLIYHLSFSNISLIKFEDLWLIGVLQVQDLQGQKLTGLSIYNQNWSAFYLTHLIKILNSHHLETLTLDFTDLDQQSFIKLIDAVLGCQSLKEACLNISTIEQSCIETIRNEAMGSSHYSIECKDQLLFLKKSGL